MLFVVMYNMPTLNKIYLLTFTYFCLHRICTENEPDLDIFFCDFST